MCISIYHSMSTLSALFPILSNFHRFPSPLNYLFYLLLYFLPDYLSSFSIQSINQSFVFVPLVSLLSASIKRFVSITRRTTAMVHLLLFLLRAAAMILHRLPLWVVGGSSRNTPSQLWWSFLVYVVLMRCFNELMWDCVCHIQRDTCEVYFRLPSSFRCFLDALDIPETLVFPLSALMYPHINYPQHIMLSFSQPLQRICCLPR